MLVGDDSSRRLYKAISVQLLGLGYVDIEQVQEASQSGFGPAVKATVRNWKLTKEGRLQLALLVGKGRTPVVVGEGAMPMAADCVSEG